MNIINLLEFIRKYGKLNITKSGSKSIFIETIVDTLVIKYMNNSSLKLCSNNNEINEHFYIDKHDPPKYNSVEIRFTNYSTNVIKHFFTMHYNAMWIAWSIETKDKDMEHRIFLREYKNIKSINGDLRIGDEDIHIYDELEDGDKLVKYLEEMLELDSRITKDGYYCPTSNDIKEKLKYLEKKIKNQFK